MGSQLKKAHRTHALAQPAGREYPHEAGGSVRLGGTADEAEMLFAELCAGVPDPSARAALLGVSLELDQAWRSGRQLPVLRAKRRLLAASLKAVRRQSQVGESEL